MARTGRFPYRITCDHHITPLLPPEQSTALDPQWEACTAWDNYGDDAYDLFYGLYDPTPCANRSIRSD